MRRSHEDRRPAELLRHDPASFDEAKQALDEDVASIDKTFAYVFAQPYEGSLQTQMQNAVAPQKDYVAKALAAKERFQTHPEDFGAAVSDFTHSFGVFEDVQEKLGEAIRASTATTPGKR